MQGVGALSVLVRLSILCDPSGSFSQATGVLDVMILWLVSRSVLSEHAFRDDIDLPLLRFPGSNLRSVVPDEHFDDKAAHQEPRGLCWARWSHGARQGASPAND